MAFRFTRIATSATVMVTTLALSATVVSAAEQPSPAATIAATTTADTTTATGDKPSPSRAESATSEGEKPGSETPSEELPPNVAPYQDPSLSSGSSSNEPGVIWHLRGLSSKIVDPIQGLKGMAIAIIVLAFLDQNFDLRGRLAAAIAASPVLNGISSRVQAISAGIAPR